MSTSSLEHLDVLIVGAGISGIGAAHHVRTRLPGKRYAILESRGELGGTWSRFRYPGLRSDSDLFTFGYAFRPWRHEQSIASADLIRDYLQAAAEQERIAGRIRYHQRVIALDWCTPQQHWVITLEHTGRGEQDGPGTGVREQVTASWVLGATGYYRYAAGHRPHFPGEESFHGEILHPQDWPAGRDVTGRRVVVIGSGATAVTIVPALATSAAHVTQVQRTPSYVVARPAVDAFAARMQRLLRPGSAHRVIRARNIAQQHVAVSAARRFPARARGILRRLTVDSLPAGHPVDVDFNPPYDPWTQRLCLAPDGDYFEALGSGRASIVTGAIRSFTERGIRLESGDELAADVIVTATGLDLLPLGGIALSLDGAAIDPAQRVVYRGAMLDGVPNFAFALGYSTSSWTLKIDPLWRYVTRLVRHTERRGYTSVNARLPTGERGVRPLLELGAGYVRRSLDQLPRQGLRRPWVAASGYVADLRLLRPLRIDDGNLRFSRR